MALDRMPAEITRQDDLAERSYQDAVRSAAEQRARGEARANETRRRVAGLLSRARTALQSTGLPELFPRELVVGSRPGPIEDALRAVERLERVVHAIEEHRQSEHRRNELTNRRARAATIAIAVAVPPLALGAGLVTPPLALVVVAIGLAAAGRLIYLRIRLNAAHERSPGVPSRPVD